MRGTCRLDAARSAVQAALGTRHAPSSLTHDVSSIPSSNKLPRALDATSYPFQVPESTMKLEHRTLADISSSPLGHRALASSL